MQFYRAQLLLIVMSFTMQSLVYAKDKIPNDGLDIGENQKEKKNIEEVVDPSFLKSVRGPSTSPMNHLPPKLMLKATTPSNKDFSYASKDIVVYLEATKDPNSVIGMLSHGQRVKVLSYYEDYNVDKKEDMLWARVQLPDKKEGYVKNKLLLKQKPTIVFSSQPKILLQHINKKHYVNASKLNMREEPSVDGYRITLLKKGDEVDLKKLSEQDDYIDGIAAKWAYVEFQGYEGWVFSGYLSDTLGGNDDNKPEDPNHIYSGSTKYVKAKVLHVRDEPGKYGTVIGAIRHNEEVQILERSNFKENIVGNRSIWVKIKHENVTGWVFGGFLSSRKGRYISSDNIDIPFIYPLSTLRMKRAHGYGPRTNPITGKGQFHTGLDVAAPRGDQIYSMGDGKVIYAKFNRGYGNLIMIKHNNGLVTYYAHQNRFNKRIRKGVLVKAGDKIGRVGSTGFSTGPHLHFEVRNGMWKKHFNPKKYIPPIEK